MGNEDLYNALYLNKITSNKKINILFDDGINTHLMGKSIFKTVNIIDGNIDEPFVRVFSDWFLFSLKKYFLFLSKNF